jgi:hypothetical protein
MAGRLSDSGAFQSGWGTLVGGVSCHRRIICGITIPLIVDLALPEVFPFEASGG